jgi:hypothetical protein
MDRQRTLPDEEKISADSLAETPPIRSLSAEFGSRKTAELMESKTYP